MALACGRPRRQDLEAGPAELQSPTGLQLRNQPGPENHLEALEGACPGAQAEPGVVPDPTIQSRKPPKAYPSVIGSYKSVWPHDGAQSALY